MENKYLVLPSDKYGLLDIEEAIEVAKSFTDESHPFSIYEAREVGRTKVETRVLYNALSDEETFVNGLIERKEDA
jgi:hypothetical protein